MAGGTTDGVVKERTLLGHPIGLTHLFFTEAAERFSYYGMRAILIYSLVNYLLLKPTADSVIGYHTAKFTFEWLGAAFTYVGEYFWHLASTACGSLTNPTTLVIALAVIVLCSVVIGLLLQRRLSIVSFALVGLFGGLTLLLALLGWIGVKAAVAPTQLIIHDLGVQPFSSLIYGNYTSFVYLTPILGGLVADRWLGQRKSVIVGAIIMAIGEFTLMSPHLFFLGLLLLIIGNGFFKPNISTQVGNLYKAGDSRIDRAFSIFYLGINLGAFFSPWVCGGLSDKYGYHWGYFAAGVGMVIGLVVYLFALRTLPPDRASRLKTHTEEKKPMTAEDWKATIALFLLFIPGSLFWAAYEQQGNTIALFAQDLTDRRLIPGLIDWQIPAAGFQSFNPFFILIFTPVVIFLWSWQAKRKTEPSVLTKMALGNIMMGASYLVMIAAVHFTGPNGQVSWLWLLLFFAVITMGELYFSPIGLALTARAAPPQIVSMMMGVWLMTSFTGNQLQGIIGSYFTRMPKDEFFLMCAAIGAFAGVVFWLFNFPLKKILADRSQVTAPMVDS
ncbi:MAG: peptide MFS transporter [Rhizomicrobium sp.]